jgi:hypothetical protein
MGWYTTFDLDRFAVAAGGYLESRAAENTLLLSAVQAARTARPGQAGTPGVGTPRAGTPDQGAGWLYGWWEPPAGGGPRGAFLHDPAAPLLITGLLPEMAASLAATLAKIGRPVLGVDAPTEAADAFAAAWSQRAGTAVRLHKHCHVYRLAGPGTAPVPAPVTPPGNPRGARPAAPPPAGRALPGAGAWPPPQLSLPPGRLRVATSSDQPLLADWLAAFANETAERIGSPPELAADLISYGGAVFWEAPQQPAGQPSALATLTRPVAGTVRISMLYTPPDRRHGGYASALTMAVTRAVLSGPAPADPVLPGPVLPGPVLPGTAGGAELNGGRAAEIVMITDRNRPDSWATRLGYQLVSERAVLRFGPVTGPVPRLPRTGPMPRLPTGPLPRVPRLRG